MLLDWLVERGFVSAVGQSDALVSDLVRLVWPPADLSSFVIGRGAFVQLSRQFGNPEGILVQLNTEKAR
jgi:hypothetical protein